VVEFVGTVPAAARATRAGDRSRLLTAFRRSALTHLTAPAQ
jgi:hypothetical protein